MLIAELLTDAQSVSVASTLACVHHLTMNAAIMAVTTGGAMTQCKLQMQMSQCSAQLDNGVTFTKSRQNVNICVDPD